MGRKAIDRTGSGKASWVINAINYAIDFCMGIFYHYIQKK